MKCSVNERSASMDRRITLMEVAFIVMVIIILAALLVPILGKAREKARRVNCAGNLKSLGLALLMYSGDNGGPMPTDPSGYAGGYFPNTVPRYVNSFGNVASEGYITSDGKVWACPSAIRQRTTVANSNYIYIGSGLKDDNDRATGTSIAHDASRNHPGNAWMNKLFIDGHVEGARPDDGKHRSSH